MTVQDQATWPEAVDLGEFTAAWRAWQTGPDGVLVRLAGDEELVIDGAVVRGRHSFGVIPERDAVNAIWGDVVIEVARRGG